MRKTAQSDYPILDLVRERWSPFAFADKPVEPAKLLTVFEAARWAPSSYNEQPWRYLIGSRDGDPETYNKLLDCLLPFNQEWARTAPVLGFSLAKRTFSHNGSPNRWGLYDAGQATGILLVQATELGLHLHQMGGYDADKARATFGISDDYDLGAAFALGYVGDPSVLPTEKLRGRHTDPTRTRRPLTELVWGGDGAFGSSSPLLPSPEESDTAG